MQVHNDAKPYDDINITPMLDLAYVLLVIFIIMTTATVQGMKVNLPKASAAPSLAQQTTKAITVAHQLHLSRFTNVADQAHAFVGSQTLCPILIPNVHPMSNWTRK